MKIKKLNKRIIVLILLFIAFSVSSYAKYYKKINLMYKSYIAEPIIIVEEISPKTIDTNYNRDTGELEYSFCVKNFEVDENGNKKFSEIEFDYEIIIENNNNNFPVRLELYDLDTEEELLKGNEKTNKEHICNNCEYQKNYKLYAIWDESKELIGNSCNAKVKVKVTQSTKGETL